MQKTIPVTIRLSEKQYKELKERAEKEYRSLSQQVVMLVDKGVQHEAKPEGN